MVSALGSICSFSSVLLHHCLSWMLITSVWMNTSFLQGSQSLEIHHWFIIFQFSLHMILQVFKLIKFFLYLMIFSELMKSELLDCYLVCQHVLIFAIVTLLWQYSAFTLYLTQPTCAPLSRKFLLWLPFFISWKLVFMHFLPLLWILYWFPNRLTYAFSHVHAIFLVVDQLL